MTLISALEGAGRHARLILLAGLVVIPFLPIPHAVFLPALPVLIAALIGLALSRLDLAAILADLADPRFLPAILAGIALFQIGAAVLLTGLGGLAGFGGVTLLILAAFAAAPVLNSAPNIALMLSYDARLALYWMLASNMLAPVTVPLALAASGVDLPVEPARIAMKVFAILAGGVAIGIVSARQLSDNGELTSGREFLRGAIRAPLIARPCDQDQCSPRRDCVKSLAGRDEGDHRGAKRHANRIQQAVEGRDTQPLATSNCGAQLRALPEHQISGRDQCERPQRRHGGQQQDRQTDNHDCMGKEGCSPVVRVAMRLGREKVADHVRVIPYVAASVDRMTKTCAVAPPSGSPTGLKTSASGSSLCQVIVPIRRSPHRISYRA